MSDRVTAYLGMGGNIGDVMDSMSGALQKFDRRADTSVKTVSPVYRTPPWGITDQDWFVNACACLETTLQPFELLEECLKIEREYGREREVRWGPRTLDLDLLLYGETTLADDRLTLPHPRMNERAFVIKPLTDLAPQLVVQGKPIGDWLKMLDTAEIQLHVRGPDWWRRAE